MASFFIPLHLDVWQAATKKIFSVDVPDADEDMEILGIEGTGKQPVFAIEDGEIFQTAEDEKNGIAILRSSADDRSWIYKNINLRGNTKEVSAGDRIGTATGAGLMLAVMDEDSPTVPIASTPELQGTFGSPFGTIPGSTTEQRLPSNPLPVLDDLNAIPLPGDASADESNTEEGRDALLGTGKKGGDLVKTAVIAGGVALGAWLLYKIVK